MKQYVLGFAFDPPRQRVLLIQKDRPAWQVGRLNGIGGKLEAGEVLHTAMAREFREETGIVTSPFRWHHFATLDASLWSVYVFAHFDTVYAAGARGPSETEQLHLSAVAPMIPDFRRMSNLAWLIPLALDAGEIHGAAIVTARYISPLP